MYGITVKTNSLLDTLDSRRSRTTGRRRNAARPGLGANLFRAGVLGMTVLGTLAGSLSLAVPAAAQIVIKSGPILSSSVAAPLPGQIITLTLTVLAVGKGAKPIQSVSYYAGTSSTAFKTLTGDPTSATGKGSESVNYMIPGNQPAGSLTFTAKITYNSGNPFSSTTTVSVGSPPALSYYVGSNSDIWSYSGATNTSTDLGGNTASNIAPVWYGNSLYFADKTGQLWQITGSNGPQKVGTVKVTATPVVTSGRIYYRGTDKQLWGAALDGSNPQELGGNNGLLDSPVVSGGYIYYVGYNNGGRQDAQNGQIYRTNLDGTSTIKLGNNVAAAPDILVSGGKIYYAGYDKGQIYRTNLDGTYTTKMNKNYANGTPAVSGNSIYYRGTDNHLYSANLSDGSNPKKLFSNDVTIYTNPSIGNGKIFFVDSKNKVWEVSLDGTGLAQIGNAPGAIAPFALDSTNQPTMGQILPKFQVGTVIYAVPGSTQTSTLGVNGNFVGYGTGASMGQTLSNTLGTSSGYDVSSNVNLGGSGVTSGITYGTSNSYDTTEITTTALTLLSEYFSSTTSDGLDHNLDQFVVIVNPAVNFSITSADSSVAYAPSTQIDPATGQPAATLTVTYSALDLKTFLSLPATKQKPSALFQGWLTVTDCKAILSLDPYVSTDLSTPNPMPVLDSTRYVPVSTMQQLPYCKVMSTDQAAYSSGTLSSSYTLSQSTSVSYDTSYTYSLTAGLATDLEGVGIGASQTYTTTNSTFMGTTNGTDKTVSQTAQYQIVGASEVAGQGMPTYIDVYIDTLYNTFMFYPHN